MDIGDKLYIYVKTWYQETPDFYYNELIRAFDTYQEVGKYLKNNIEIIEDIYPIVDIVISIKRPELHR